MSWQFERLTENPLGLTEGPAWDGRGLVFTNTPNNRIVRFDPADNSFQDFQTETNAANGLMFDKDGRLYACEGDARRIVRYEADHSVTVICDHFEGKRFNSPNDLAVDTQGRIWFTDPRFGD